MRRRKWLSTVFLINIILMSGCLRLFAPEPSYVDDFITNHHERLYTVSGISFLPPAAPPLRQKPWQVIKRFAEGTKTEFYAYRFRAYIPQSSQENCCFIELRLDEDVGKVASDIAATDMDELLLRSHRSIEVDRLKRKELLRGTLEERWQEALQAEPDLVAKTVKNMKKRDEKTKKLVPVRRYSKAKQAEIAESSFKYHLEQKRALYRNLPPDAAHIININGKRCLNTVRYEGLPTILTKEYATSTSGGTELNYSIYCPIDTDKVFKIYLFTKIPPNEIIDSYPIIEPIINSISWASH